MSLALRNASNTIGNMKADIPIARFFKRLAFKYGRAAAITATARKLSVIIWNMVVKTQPYNPPTEYLLLDQKRKLKLVTRVRKTIAKFGIKAEDVVFAIA